LFKQLQALVRDDSGTATVEYSLVVALFGVTIISAFQVVLNESGSQLSTSP
jgi:Flp pilus assembly pilin Flp